MTLFRGSGENLPLSRWLGEVLWPREAHLTEEDVYWGMTLAAAELLRFGVTTTCEAYFHEDALADAVIDAGLAGPGHPGGAAVPGRHRDDGGGTADRGDRRLPRPTPRRPMAGSRWASPRTPPTPCRSPCLVDIAEAARAARRPVPHPPGRDRRRSAGGSPPSTGARSRRCWPGPGCSTAACWPPTASGCPTRTSTSTGSTTWPWPTARRATPSWPPGWPRWRRCLAEGIRVGLATDGPASNNDLDLWEEMRSAAMLARIRERDAAALPAAAPSTWPPGGPGWPSAGPTSGCWPPGAQADMMAVGPGRSGVRTAPGRRPADRPPGVVGLEPTGHRRLGGRGAGGGGRTVPRPWTSSAPATRWRPGPAGCGGRQADRSSRPGCGPTGARKTGWTGTDRWTRASWPRGPGRPTTAWPRCGRPPPTTGRSTGGSNGPPCARWYRDPWPGPRCSTRAVVRAGAVRVAAGTGRRGGGRRRQPGHGGRSPSPLR